MSEDAATIYWSDRLALVHASRSVTDLRAALEATRMAYVVLIDGDQYYAYRVSELKERLSRAPADPTVAEWLKLDSATPTRWIRFGPLGTPTEVGDDHPIPDNRLLRSAPQRYVAPAAAAEPWADERTDVVRYPSIQWERALDNVALTVNLARTGDASERIRIGGLSENWGELPVHVQLMSTALTFPDGGDQGIVYVRRNADSVPCTLHATIHDDQAEVIATFSYEGRFGGFARVMIGGPASPRSTVSIDDSAAVPDLTVKIFHPERSSEGCFAWSLTPSRRFDGLPAKLSGEIDLGARPGDYTASLYQRLRELVPGKHMSALEGIGERLWDKAPDVFRQTYWAMRDEMGSRFSIQFISDDPYIPWELMRPYRDKEAAPLIAAQHPVARWIASYDGLMRNRLPGGRIVTVAPKYKNDVLPAAQDEAERLENQFQATRIPGTTADVMRLLEDKLDGLPVGLMHFAGHGQFGVSSADRSRILLEDGSLYLDEVDNQRVLLGEKHRTLVLLNACEVGATGAVLGSVGGWAEAFTRRKFGGLVAPLWAVIDDDAATVIAELVDMVWQRCMPVGKALTAIRAKYGEDSPTFFSYVFYGDVTATLTCI